MHGFRLLWESATDKKPEYGIFGFDREADVNSARLVSAVFLRQRLTDSQAERLGLALHYAYGGAIGASYAALSSRLPQGRSTSGLAFGVVLWLLGDELPVSLSGVSNPFRKTAASHAGALACHLLFSAVVERILL